MAAPRRMVLDTDVASRIFRGQDLDPEERQALTTHNQLPLLTRNRKDFDPLTAHGLTLL